MTTTLSAESASSVGKADRKLSLRAIEVRWGLLFIAPWIIGFLIFGAIPIATSLYYSFTDFNLTSKTEPRWIGTANYQKMLGLEVTQMESATGDPLKAVARGNQLLFQIPGTTTVVSASDALFWKSMRVTLTFALIALPLSLFVALMLAVLTNMNIPFVRMFRTVFYLPYMVPAVAATVIFRDVLGRDIGWLNNGLERLGILSLLGISRPDWLNNENIVLIGLAIIGLWGIGNAMIIYLAGLQGVPTELYDAAKVDGANVVQQFTRITLPMISPVILYNLVIGLIGSFQYFVTPYVLSDGRGTPNDSMYFFNMYLYKQGFAYTDMGYASALAWILLIIVVLITVIVFATSGSWVFYAGAKKS